MKFDVAVIGAGSSGCATAGHLSRTTGLAIALVEGGPDYGPFSAQRWPDDLLDPRVSSATHDWGYVRAAAGGAGGQPYSRAKVVGGCSAHNQCAAVWPFPEDYDGWSADGLIGWDHADLHPLIRMVESEVQRRSQADAELGHWQRCFLETALESGYSRLSDLSGPERPVGVMPFHVNIRRSVRWNAAFTFLDAVRNSHNLTLYPSTVVEKLVIRQHAAAGVLCRSTSGQAFTIEADRIVLSAGAIGSPLLLMRSGVGPAGHLRDVDIECEIDLSGVGENLHDHHGVRVILEPMGGALEAVRQDQATGQPAPSQVVLHERSSRSTLPDLHILPADVRPGDSIVKLMVMNMAPRSRGRVRLSGAASGDDPQIDFAFLADDYDVDVVLEGVDKVRALPQFGRELAPAGQDDERAYLRRNATSYAHAAGSCRMGVEPAAGAVVNAEGRVYGLDNVWIADASIMPRLPRANTNLACYLIGYRMAEVIAGRLPRSRSEHPQPIV